MKCTIFVDILLLIGVVYLFSMCRESTASDNKTNADYTINYYLDTINSHVILSTVCDKYNSLSISTLELKD